MKKSPDGKSMGLVHDVIWQSAALGLALKSYSQAEYEFSKLTHSVRNWKQGYSSRNYITLLREHFFKNKIQ